MENIDDKNENPINNEDIKQNIIETVEDINEKEKTIFELYQL
jgi:DNA-directed RNA polymerase specialized sigma subunit